MKEAAHNIELLQSLVSGYPYEIIGNSVVVNADCLEWLSTIPNDSLHAIVTDPPYGVKEYEFDQMEKRKDGKGGIWRLPPTFDGSTRAPLPRFTALSQKERNAISDFFRIWSELVTSALRPGGHVFVASNAFISQLTFSAIIDGGLEFRGEVIRQVRTLRGGDRPKNAEDEFPEVSSLPRGCYEPWGIFRKPLLPKMKVSDCLREFQTGGIRRLPDGQPFTDVIDSERTPRTERKIADHPSLKPQSFLRRIVYAALPLGKGVIVDPFMGSGSTLAAAEAVGLFSIGVERHSEYYDMSKTAIPALRNIKVKDQISTALSTNQEMLQQTLL